MPLTIKIQKHLLLKNFCFRYTIYPQKTDRRIWRWAIAAVSFFKFRIVWCNIGWITLPLAACIVLFFLPCQGNSNNCICHDTIPWRSCRFPRVPLWAWPSALQLHRVLNLPLTAPHFQNWYKFSMLCTWTMKSDMSFHSFNSN